MDSNTVNYLWHICEDVYDIVKFLWHICEVVYGTHVKLFMARSEVVCGTCEIVYGTYVKLFMAHMLHCLWHICEVVCGTCEIVYGTYLKLFPFRKFSIINWLHICLIKYVT